MTLLRADIPNMIILDLQLYQWAWSSIHLLFKSFVEADIHKLGLKPKDCILNSETSTESSINNLELEISEVHRISILIYSKQSFNKI